MEKVIEEINISANGSYKQVLINQRSDEANEIISNRQGFIMQYSLVFFLIILISLAVMTWFIKYPDIIRSGASLITFNEPKEILANHNGHVTKLFLNNENNVLAKQPIAWIESTASHEDVIRLSEQLDRAAFYLNRNETQRIQALFDNSFNNLGEIQSYYQQFSTGLLQFVDYLNNGYYYKKRLILQDDLEYLAKMHKNYEQQKLLTDQDLQLAEETYNANNSLYKDKVISQQELRDQKSRLVLKKMSTPQLQSLILTNENIQTAKTKEIVELDHTVSQQKLIFEQAVNTLKSHVDDWIKSFVVSAPIKGKLILVNPIQVGQHLKIGANIGYIDPGNGRYYAQVNLRQFNFGKLKIGQNVQLRFEAYPYQEFGFVRGKLNYISSIPTDSGFLARIELPNGLVTSQGKTIQYRTHLKSEALIITNDLRLFERFYQGLIKIINK